jgi:hypothetical protein
MHLRQFCKFNWLNFCRSINFDSRIGFVAMGSDLSDSELQRLRELRAQAFARNATIEAELGDLFGIEGDEPQLREVEGDEPQLREVEGDEPEVLEVEGEVEGDKPDVPEVEGEVETPQLREGLDGDQCDFVALTPQSKANLIISSLEAGTELNFKISTCRKGEGGKWILAGRINGRFICGMHLEHMTILGPGQQIRLIGEDDAAAAAAGVDQATTQEDDEEEDEEETEDTSRGLTELNGVSFDAVGESEPRRRRLNEQLDAF